MHTSLMFRLLCARAAEICSLKKHEQTFILWSTSISHQKSNNTFIMVKPKAQKDKPSRYGIFYPEGTGYLHLSEIDAGTQGSVVLVYSCADKQIYVRKRGKNIGIDPIGFTIGHGCDEVYYYRIHKLIPRLVDWTVYRPLVRSHPGYFYNASTSTIWEFCRGGDLRAVIEAYKTLNETEGHTVQIYPVKHQIPEAFIWKVLGQLIQVLAFIHHAHPPIGHLDIFLGNIFLRPAEDSVLPDCCLGDFGKSAILVPSGATGVKANMVDPSGMASRYMAKDYDEVILVVKQLMTLRYSMTTTESTFAHRKRMDSNFDDLETAHTGDLDGVAEAQNARASLHLLKSSTRTRFQSSVAYMHQTYTPLLFDTIRQLERRVRAASQPATYSPTDTNFSKFDGLYLGEALVRKAEERLRTTGSESYPTVNDTFREEMGSIEKSFSEEDVRSMILLNKAKVVNLIRSRRTVGPFRIAKLDPATLDVVGISRKTYRTFDYSDDADSQDAESKDDDLRNDSAHSVAVDPTQTDTIRVTRRLSFDRWAQ